MISKKLDNKPVKMLKIELSDDDLWLLKKAVGRSGMKQQSWLRAAIIEKVIKEGGENAFNNH